MPHLQALILAAILLAAIQAEASHVGLGGQHTAHEQVGTLDWLSASLVRGSPCTGVDLNVGCVSIDFMGQAGE